VRGAIETLLRCESAEKGLRSRTFLPTVPANSESL
jgi:hypothetical protein